MPTWWWRCLLFLSSYSLLTPALFLLFFWKQPAVAVGVALLGIVGGLSLIVYLRSAGHLEGEWVPFRKAQLRDAENMRYLPSYLLPLVALPFYEQGRAWAFLYLFALVGLIYIKSNTTYFNPLLNLCGYHIFEITLADDSSFYLITRQRQLWPGDKVYAVRTGDDLYLTKRPPAKEMGNASR